MLNTPRRLPSQLATLVMILLLFMPSTQASSSAQAQKDEFANVKNTAATFTIAKAQTIKWKALYFGDQWDSRQIVLERQKTPPTEIIYVTSSLVPGANVGTYYLDKPGTYEIEVGSFHMGPGNYSIYYDRVGAFTVQPQRCHFGDVPEAATSEKTFTITHIGDPDDAPVTITGASCTGDCVHFAIRDSPVGDDIPTTTTPPHVTFRVTFDALSNPGTHSATFTLSGVSPEAVGDVPSVSFTVTGTTKPKEPDIECGAPKLGWADWKVGAAKTLTYSFSNVGTKELVLYSIGLESDPSGGSVFSLAAQPALTPLPPGKTRNVQILFAPMMEKTYQGHLNIVSDDPDEGTAGCAFEATGHHPAPKLVLESADIDYGAVEVDYRFRQAVKIENAGDADLSVDMAAYDLSDPDWSSFPDCDVAVKRTIPKTETRLYEMSFLPDSKGGKDVVVVICNTNEEPTSSEHVVHLHGTGVDPSPLATMLAVDRSGSMAGKAGDTRKIAAVTRAGVLYTELIHDKWDWLGIAGFNEDAAVIEPLGQIAANRSTVMWIWENGESYMHLLKPAGATSIGDGLAEAAQQFSGSPGEHAKAMVVMTDGKENAPLSIDAVLPQVTSSYPDLRIFCVGVGDPIETGAMGKEGVESAKLQRIAEDSKAQLHRVIRELTGEARYDLERFYFKAFAKAKGRQVVTDPVYFVPWTGGPSTWEIATVPIVTCDRDLDVVVISDMLGTEREIVLEAPTGQVISVGSAVGGLPVEIREWDRYRLYRVRFPRREFASEYVGSWRLLAKSAADSSAAGLIAPHLQSVVVMAAVGSDYRMEASVTKGRVTVNQPLLLLAKFTEAWWPAPNTTTTVDVTKPDGAGVHLTLHDDGLHGDRDAGDGVFGCEFLDTGHSGYYEFLFRGTGTTERREKVVREELLAKYEVGPDERRPAAERFFVCWNVGATLPLAGLDSLSDSNVHASADWGYRLNDSWHLLMRVGLSQFTGEWKKGGEHPRWVHASANARALFPAAGATGLLGYVNAGIGSYWSKTASVDLGFNAGLGAIIPIGAWFGLECGIDYHHVIVLDSDLADFLTLRLGAALW